MLLRNLVYAVAVLASGSSCLVTKESSLSHQGKGDSSECNCSGSESLNSSCVDVTCFLECPEVNNLGCKILLIGVGRFTGKLPSGIHLDLRVRCNIDVFFCGIITIIPSDYSQRTLKYHVHLHTMWKGICVICNIPNLRTHIGWIVTTACPNITPCIIISGCITKFIWTVFLCQQQIIYKDCIVSRILIICDNNIYLPRDNIKCIGSVGVTITITISYLTCNCSRSHLWVKHRNVESESNSTLRSF